MVSIFNKVDALKTAWKTNASMRFLSWVVIGHFFWTGIYWAWIVKSPPSDQLSFHLAHITTDVLKSMGFDCFNLGSTIYMNGQRGVEVGNSCNGLDFFGLFMCFVLAYPTAFKHKWWFGLVGICSIHILNIMRLVLLVIIYVKSPANFEFNHHYTFVILIYGTLFIMWLLWAKKYQVYGHAE